MSALVHGPELGHHPYDNQPVTDMSVEARKAVLENYRGYRVRHRRQMSPPYAMLRVWLDSVWQHAISGHHIYAVEATYAQRYLSMIVQRSATLRHWR